MTESHESQNRYVQLLENRSDRFHTFFIDVTKAMDEYHGDTVNPLSIKSDALIAALHNALARAQQSLFHKSPAVSHLEEIIKRGR